MSDQSPVQPLPLHVNIPGCAKAYPGEVDRAGATQTVPEALRRYARFGVNAHMTTAMLHAASAMEIAARISPDIARLFEDAW